jgi:hypothetical protein
LNIEVKKRVSELIPGEEITPGESNSIPARKLATFTLVCRERLFKRRREASCHDDENFYVAPRADAWIETNKQTNICLMTNNVKNYQVRAYPWQKTGIFGFSGVFIAAPCGSVD